MTLDKTVFTGQDAIKDFLNPGNLPYLPLVELPRSLNPLADDGVRIQAKLMNLLPLGNVKAVPAYNMIMQKALSGELEGVEHLIENSSGNTVFSLAIAARQFGVNQTSAYVPAEISWNKLLMLLFFGVQPIVNQEPQNPTENDHTSGVYKARQDGGRADTLNPGQYENPDNPGAHQNGPGRRSGTRQTGGSACIARVWAQLARLSAPRPTSGSKTPTCPCWA